ncbi:MAG TPA: retropepsin-like aspartic protease [Candidatus Elarobacter sp.]
MRAAAAFAALLMLLPGVAAAQAALSPPLFRTAETVPQTMLSRFENRVLVQGRVGRRDLWFHLDTGSAGLVLSTSAARSLGFPAVAGGTVTADLDVGTLHAQAAVFRTIDYAVRDAGYDVSGIIGAPFFRSNVVTLDFRTRHVIVYPRGFPPAAFAGAPAPLVIERGIPHVRVTWGGEPARLLLDTGSQYTFLFPARAARMAQVRPVPGVDFNPLPLAVGEAPTRIREFTVPPIRIADTELRLAGALVPDDVPPRLRGDDGIFGRDACRAFSITLDYAHGVAYWDSE